VSGFILCFILNVALSTRLISFTITRAKVVLKDRGLSKFIRRYGKDDGGLGALRGVQGLSIRFIHDVLHVNIYLHLS